MVWLPFVSVDVEHVATPFDALHCTAQPIALPLSVKLTVPLSDTELVEGETEAVKVTS